MLAHSRHYKNHISPDFGRVVELLLEFSRRWSGVDQTGDKCTNLAARFAARLIQARDDPEDHPLLDMNLPDCFSEIDSPRPIENYHSKDSISPDTSFPTFQPSLKRQLAAPSAAWPPLPTAKKQARHEGGHTSFAVVSPRSISSNLQKMMGRSLSPVIDNKERSASEDYSHEFLEDLQFYDTEVNDVQSSVLDFGQGFNFYAR